MGKVIIPLFDNFDIETYDGLLGFLERHLELDQETVSQLPTLIRLAEYELDRMLTPSQREVSVESVTTAGVGFVALPDYHRQIETVHIAGEYPLHSSGLSDVQLMQAWNGKPTMYAVSEEALQLGPLPDGAYTLKITYQTRIPPLSASNQTNWLIAQHADAYLFAALVQVLLFQNDDQRATLFRPHLVTIMGQINQQGERYRFGSQLTPRVYGTP